VISEDEKSDLITNMLACSANDLSQAARVEDCINKMNKGNHAAHETVYELFFN
jgi:hypothetical protein